MNKISMVDFACIVQISHSTIEESRWHALRFPCLLDCAHTIPKRSASSPLLFMHASYMSCVDDSL